MQWISNETETRALMSLEDVLPREKTCVRLCFEIWELAINKIRDMVDTNAAPLPGSVLRNLGDKLYEKRKAAALEVENAIRALIVAKDHPSITKIISLVIYEFALSPLVNRRKGGLIALAAAIVGLAPEAAQYLQNIVPPIIKSFSDDDNRVRYYACEALYNIAKVTREDMLIFFNQIFDALCKLSADVDPAVQDAGQMLDRLVKDIVTDENSNSYNDLFSIEDFIPLLRERMNVHHPMVRQFLVGWITLLDGVPNFDMLGFLPDFLDGLFNMLSDSSHEIRQKADQALTEFLQEIKNSPSVEYRRMADVLIKRAGSPDEFTRLTAITWINEFLKLGGDQLVKYYAEILGRVLPCISDEEEKIQVVARETNQELRSVNAPPSEDFDIGAILVIARRELMNEHEATRLEALRWISLLLERHRTEVLSFFDDIFPALLSSLSDPTNAVAQLVLEIQADIARDPNHFRHLLVFLVERFNTEHNLLERRGTMALRSLCQSLGPERVYRELAAILEKERDLNFANVMVQALNSILLIAPELKEVRKILKDTLTTLAGLDLYLALYGSWCHAPVATISLCLLAQTYPHAASLIQSLGERDITVPFLVQLDRLVRLLETPVFAYLRLQLVESARYPSLIKALNGLLLLLPQSSEAFGILRKRLRAVPPQTWMHSQSPGLSHVDDFPGLRLFREPPAALNAASSAAGPSTAPPISLTSLSLLGGGGAARPEDGAAPVPGINFAIQMRQYEQIQQQHRAHRVAENVKEAGRRPPVVTNQQQQSGAQAEGVLAEPRNPTEGIVPRSNMPVSPPYGYTFNGESLRTPTGVVPRSETAPYKPQPRRKTKK